ncbi:hypothetical protein ACJMK2_014516 [Sinanodonta woodiana]|uniref:Uncharacterized protein n=1 Tax=Sinanodonta woodiana TaxID=1069815 RepID=A0ABD3V1M1_SINWO
MERNTPGYYRHLSLRLFNVLDKVGLSEHVRCERINMMLEAKEIKFIITEGPIYILGNKAEARTAQ